MPLSFLNDSGDFTLDHAQRWPGVYFPLANEGGMMSSVTPLLSGDCKTGQNTFLLAPAGAETLHESRAGRNFWVNIDGEPWSAAGQSAPQQGERFTDREEDAVLTGGLLWQGVSRTHRASGLRADVLSFVPAGRDRVEVMQVALTNGGDRALTLAPTAAVPVYGRSADNIRDHRHVTSLLHRVELRPHGLDVTPTLTFDERGHQPGRVTYRVWGGDETGAPPAGFVPLVRDFVGQGSYDWPEAVVCSRPDAWLRAGQEAQGGEIVAALFFPAITLLPGQRCRYQVVLAVDDSPAPYLTPDGVSAALADTKAWWQGQVGQTFRTGDGTFDAWMRWVAVQPLLRRIFGCSFLPHHDYGRGGRGWRDLWQDSLALLLTGPDRVRGDLLGYFAGVRTDGTNATIIGSKPGEFKADRNNIPRVWMDHGFWPLLTTALYLDETGDDRFLLEQQTYFSDCLPHRGEGTPRETPAPARSGTVLEHLLTQLAAAFFDVGEHGHMRLRGADWNDGLDMASRRGESVAFTAAYAYGFDLLAQMVERLAGAVIEASPQRPARQPVGWPETLTVSAPLAALLDFPAEGYGDPAAMRAALAQYCREIDRTGEKLALPALPLAERLRDMARWVREHIARTEWVGDGADLHWFNSYYDDSGRQVEGLRGKAVRMMLTGQVFCILSGAADEGHTREIIRAADWYLCDPGRGGILPGIPEYFDDRGQGMYPYLTGAGSWLLLTLQTQAFGVRGLRGDLLLEPKLTTAQFDEAGTAEITCTAAGRALRLRYENPLRLDWGGYEIGAVRCGERSWAGGGASRLIPRAELPQADGPLELAVTLIPKGGKTHV